MGTDKVKIQEYYDNYGKNDFEKGCNARHLFLYNKLLNNGLKKDSTILELGCGVGIITKLISNTVKYGKIVVCDISSQSIEYSKKVNTQENIEFIVSDITTIKYENTKYDFITLFDVLEHVPEESHEIIFKNIVMMMHNNSKLLIHLPTYENIVYTKNNHPEELQIIDHAITVIDILKNTSNSMLRLHFMELSNIWHYGDYQLFVFCLNKPYNANPVKEKNSFIKKLINKL